VAKARRGRRRRPSGTDRPDTGGSREHWRADGLPKTRFDRAEDANRASLRLRLEDGADLDPYRCGYCQGWHLGNRRG